ncbi:MAG: hypothetical protein ACLQOO_09565 [Terriglobia bacterium]
MSAPAKKDLANHEIVTLAIFLLGGDSAPVDLEEIAMKANEIAPGRFTWRRYPTQINIKNVDAFLWDAKKPKNGSFVLNVRRDEWILTEKGLAFAKENIRILGGADLSRKAMSAKDRNWMRRERDRMLCSEASQKFAAGQAEQITTQDAEAFFRLDAYVTGKPRKEKILRTKNLFGADSELGPLINAAEAKLPTRGEQ